MATATEHPFSLTPAQADNEVIIYTSSKGKKLFNSATAKLNIEFNGNPANLKIFLESLHHCTRTSNWLKIMSIPDHTGTRRSIINEYGQITMLDVSTDVSKYQGRNCRDAQNCYQLYMCLLESITKEAFLKVDAYTEQYLLGASNEPSSVCFLYMLIQCATIHTKATINTIRKSLYKLDFYMTKVGDNIEKFNQYVKLKWGALMSHGEKAPGLITNLFVAYEGVQDSAFQTYMTAQQNAYEDGSKDFTEDQLMEVALNKYKVLMELDKWNTPSAQDSKMVALTTKIDALKLQGSSTSSYNDKKKGNNHKSKADNAWKKIVPGEGEPKRKSVGKMTYHWCINHQYWTLHSSTKCKGIKVTTNESNNHSKASNADKIDSTSCPNKLLHATNALVSLLDHDKESK